MQIFIDESGGKGQGAYMVLSGLANTAESWMSLADDWKRCLRASPRIRYFKFSEAGTLTGEFHGLSPDLAKEKVYLLKSLVEKRKPTAVFCAVDVREFSELFEPMRAVLRGPRLNALNQPYLWAACHLFEAIHGWAEDRGLDQLEIVFDEQDRFELEAKREYERFRASGSEDRKRIMPLELRFRNDKDCVLLQAADLVAGVLRRRLHNDEDIPIAWRHMFCGIQLELKISKRSVIFNREKLISVRAAIAQSLIQRMESDSAT